MRSLQKINKLIEEEQERIEEHKQRINDLTSIKKELVQKKIKNRNEVTNSNKKLNISKGNSVLKLK